MGGGNIAYGCADFRNGQIGLVQQAFRLFAADGVVIPKQRVSGFPFEDPGEVISIYKERRSNPGERELLLAVLPDKISRLLRKALSGGGSG